MKARELKRELKEMSEAELRQKEKEFTEALFNLKFQHATGQLENTERLPQARRGLARVKTLLRGKAIAGGKSK